MFEGWNWNHLYLYYEKGIKTLKMYYNRELIDTLVISDMTLDPILVIANERF
jgi:hypothetical protein